MTMTDDEIADAAIPGILADLAADGSDASDGSGGSEQTHQEPPEDGAVLLDELHRALTAYVIFPTSEAADAVTLFIAATHAQSAWEHATRLVVKSPLKRCGKTRLQEVCRETVHNPLPTTNISAAALARSITEDDPPTLILDEADTVWGKKDQRAEAAEDIRGILNSGHSRGWPYVRWDAANRRREHCPTFAMAIVGGIGDMPDTIEDRAVVIPMRRRAPGESVRAWRSRRAVPALRNLRDRIHAWMRSIVGELAEAEPDLPAEDRAADVWEPLVAVADAAGGDWPDRARKACQVFTGAGDDPEDGTASERLLADLRKLFGTAAQLPTETILAGLAKVDEAPWATWHRGDPLSPRGLAGLLKPYGVKSKVIRVGDTTPRGYLAADLTDAWDRYVPDPGAPPQQAQHPQPQDLFSTSAPVAHGVADPETASATEAEQQQQRHVADVADVADSPPESDYPEELWALYLEER